MCRLSGNPGVVLYLNLELLLLEVDETDPLDEYRVLVPVTNPSLVLWKFQGLALGVFLCPILHLNVTLLA
jgi:hypothetical protein